MTIRIWKMRIEPGERQASLTRSTEEKRLIMKKNEITITKTEMTRKLLIASSRAAAQLGDKVNKPEVTMLVNLLNTILVGEIIKILFDEDVLEIQDDDK